MVVRMRHTKGHTANRRSHHALKGARFVTCSKCSAQHLMHRVCGNCGTYRGRMVVDTLKKEIKKTKKAEARKGNTTPAEALKGKVKKEASPKVETKKKTEVTKRSKTENG